MIFLIPACTAIWLPGTCHPPRSPEAGRTELPSRPPPSSQHNPNGRTAAAAAPASPSRPPAADGVDGVVWPGRGPPCCSVVRTPCFLPHVSEPTCSASSTPRTASPPPAPTHASEPAGQVHWPHVGEWWSGRGHGASRGTDAWRQRYVHAKQLPGACKWLHFEERTSWFEGVCDMLEICVCVGGGGHSMNLRI